MSKARPAIVNMNGGEVDGEYLSRVDLDGYANRAAVLENAFPRVLGGIEKAPGTKHLERITTNSAVILKRFRFSVNQAFLLVLEPNKIRIIQEDSFSDVSRGAVLQGSWSAVSPPPPPPPPSPPPPPPEGGSVPGDPGYVDPVSPDDPYNPRNPGFSQYDQP